MNRSKIIKEIDDLLSLYCEGCFLRLHFRKTYGNTHAHQFCIKECTVGENLQVKGKYLINEAASKK
ncbi:zinc-finger domain-containing protein [Lederbergia citrea]|uniref:Zinc-finger domain-containing protein n=1 Tax=Lederbergia citrea TaxID=2833581 RepID=A0A942UNU3_9BACI|nr:zinc-finger domain-containing protein [Lederbergia citrea]MBS4176625.1 zinc-finger domain-containing protein [Lederbergia citrea]MBS4203186.1 zinc-finger domain-containing protein [Lederbergia citrea]MBS4222143.1 zinc-finger domain-containing protein [Lederbergia citrea]